MKHLLTAIACCLAVGGSAQFIPQPMGYNPDSNSDGVIGSEDPMGMLALYGLPYETSDSIVVGSVSFIGAEYDTLQVPENVDVLYVHSNWAEVDMNQQNVNRYLKLPIGSGWKSLVVMPITENTYEEWSGNYGTSHMYIRLLVPADDQRPDLYGTGWIEIGNVTAFQTWNNRLKIFIRDHYGNWRKDY